MLGKSRILSLFRNSFIKFNKTWALMLDPLYGMSFRCFPWIGGYVKQYKSYLEQSLYNRNGPQMVL